MSNATRCRRYRQNRHHHDIVRDMVRDMVREQIQPLMDMLSTCMSTWSEFSTWARDMLNKQNQQLEEHFTTRHSDMQEPPFPNGFPPKEIPPLRLPSKEITLFPLTPSPRTLSNGVAFDRFWENYPNKVGKGAARKAFTKALTKTSLDQLMDGLNAYKRNKPADREWCNPATWLNQERWLDKPAVNGHAVDHPVSLSRGPPAPLTDEQRARIMGRLPA